MPKNIVNTKKNLNRLNKLFTKKQLTVSLLETLEVLYQTGSLKETKHIKIGAKK